MTRREIDAERLAELIDRRLDEHQRAKVLARLAASEEEIEIFVDAVAVTRELEPSGVAGEAIPIQRSKRARWWQRPDRRWLALAAVLAGIALAPWLWTRAAAPDPSGPGDFVVLLESEDGGLPEGWNGRPWAATRGAGDPLTAEARAVRLGARLVDLELAARARDTAAALIAGNLIVLLDGVPAAGPVSAIYREVARRAGEPPDELAPLLEQGRTAVARLAGEDRVELGAWVEAARIASERQDEGFFRNRASRTMLDVAAAHPELEPSAREGIERIRAAIAVEDAPEWRVLNRELTELLRMLGS